MMNSLTSSCGQQRVLRSGRLIAPTVPQQPYLLRSGCQIALTRIVSALASTASTPSSAASADKYTQLAADCLRNGNGLARRILSDSSIEGDPLAFLKATEAYWKAMKQQKHEPHKKGPTVVTTSSSSFTSYTTQSAASHTRAADQHTSRGNPATSSNGSSSVPDYDIIMCGGTLGIMVALALQQQGFRVAVVEKRLAQGRTQEWNTSRHECQVLVDLGLLTQAELESTIVSEFNPVRCGFKGGEPLWVNDCLNIGVCPKTLLALLRNKFEALGGVIMEYTMFKSAVVCPDGVAVSVSSSAEAPADIGDTNRPNALQQRRSGRMQQQHGRSQPDRAGGGHLAGGLSLQSHGVQGPQGNSHHKGILSCRLLLDCMGHYSPIVKQIRGRAKPQGMVLVVGGCATGFPEELNQHADLLYTMTDSSADMQLFWEAFPAEGGQSRTTYMFAYSDAQPDRPSFEKLLDTYFKLMPAYQNLPSGLDDIKFKRVLFGGFPCYGSSPLKPGFDRVLQLGDASASQSPLSFGGFGCMLRHLPRFSAAISHGLRADRLSRGDLSWIHAYQPSLSAAWLFQRSMSVGVGQLQQEQQQVEQDSSSIGSSSSSRGLTAKSSSSSSSSSHTVADASVQSNIVPVHISNRVTRVVHSNDSSSRIASGSSSSVVQDGVFSRWAQQLQQPSTAVRSTSSSSSTAAAVGTSAHMHASTSSSRGHNAPHAADKQNSSSSKASWLSQLLLLPSNHVNALLAANFSVMAVLGQRVLKPFLQDTLQLGPLAVTMCGMMMVKPLVVCRVLCQVGGKVLFSWFGHFAALTVYSVAHWLLSPLRRFSNSYTLHRLLDILEYGSSSDYKYSASERVSRSVRQQVEQAQADAAAKLAAASSAAESEVQQVWQRQQQLRQRRKMQQQQQEEAVDVQDLRSTPAAAAAAAGLVPAA